LQSKFPPLFKVWFNRQLPEPPNHTQFNTGWDGGIFCICGRDGKMGVLLSYVCFWLSLLVCVCILWQALLTSSQRCQQNFEHSQPLNYTQTTHTQTHRGITIYR